MEDPFATFAHIFILKRFYRVYNKILSDDKHFSCRIQSKPRKALAIIHTDNVLGEK